MGKVRVPIRSQYWLDYCFTKDEAENEEKDEVKKGRHCRFCGGPMNGREDKELEHIALTHIIQAVKNLDEYDTEALENQQMTHLVCTEEQYLYARKENVVRHLKAVHKNDPLSE